MNEFDFPPTHVDGDRDGAGRPRPRRHRRAFLTIVVFAAFATAAVASLVAIYGIHLGSRSTPGSGASFTVVQASQLSRPASSSAIAARVDPGLVNINVMDGSTGAQGAATGMVLTSSGVVLTNNHVIQGATSITATDVGNRKTYAAKDLSL
jgi:S1-C subfamily serine protease